VVKVGKALKESGGAAAEYQDAVNFLEGVGKTLTGSKRFFRITPIWNGSQN
jgi:hypothetical protein